MNPEKLRTTLKTMGENLFPVEKVTSYIKSIKSKSDLQKFIQQRSAHVTQTTLYGYLKTRIGVKFTAMVEDDVFSKSINIAKWNIYMTAIADCALYVFSYASSGRGIRSVQDGYILGDLVEDYIYDSAQGTLDEYNGKFGPTPEYPNGTYAYFLTEKWPVIPRGLKGEFINLRKKTNNLR